MCETIINIWKRERRSLKEYHGALGCPLLITIKENGVAMVLVKVIKMEAKKTVNIGSMR